MAHENTAHLVTYVTKEEQNKLRLLAAKKGISVSSYLRDVVRDHLKNIDPEEG